MKPKLITRRAWLSSLAIGSGAAVLGCYRTGTVKNPPDRELTRLDLSEAAAALRRREISPVELTQACLERIERIDPQLNSFITVMREQALAEALRAEDEIANGRWLGPLHGIPIGVKDNIDTAGVRTTAASAIFLNRIPTEDADVIKQLKAAGAIIIGKLNMHEFAGGTTSAISHFGPVHNPWDLDRIAGGSSGGNGAAVAAGLCFGSVGTDTGGSIRIPASACGIVGLKPTYDVVSTKGLVYVSRSFDHIGPMCRTVADTALMFGAMTGHAIAKDFDPALPPPVSGLRVGLVPAEVPMCDAAVDPEVKGVVDAAIDVIRSLVGAVRDAGFSIPELGDIIGAEEYPFHAKFVDETPELYDPRTRGNILEGRKVAKADYTRMINKLAQHRKTVGKAFSEVDLVVLPTLPGLPMTIKEATDPFSLNACTFAFSIGGLPAISIPCGFSRSGLPIGLMIGGPPLSEPRILALAAAYEKAAGWEKQRPSI